MKIQIVSDIHLEFGHNFHIDNAGADVLILAGDICCARHIDKHIGFFAQCSDKFKSIIYIMGNHEHYKHTFNDTASVIRKALSRFDNIHLLDNQVLTIDGLKFIGATLWTDMNANCPLTKNKLMFGMNDFRLIKYKNRRDDYMKFGPGHAYAEHQISKAFIESQILFDDAPHVIVTHHAPSFRSIHPRYANDTHMNGGYASNMEDLMTQNVKLWIHGHTHTPFDYMVNDTRVLCNPMGYPNERNGPNPNLILEI